MSSTTINSVNKYKVKSSFLIRSKLPKSVDITETLS